MPGDPKRSRFVAERFLENAVLVNDVRGVQGYTGYYKGARVSVMASGMGMPSMGIYSYELFNFYGVENIIRIGSAGSVNPALKLGDVVLGKTAYTLSTYGKIVGFDGCATLGVYGGHTDENPFMKSGCGKSVHEKTTGFSENYAVAASPKLLQSAVEISKTLDKHIFSGILFSSDVFYDGNILMPLYEKLNVDAVEMEAAALYINAALSGKNALAVCTVSDSIITGESSDAATRQYAFTDMMEIALNIAALND
jgi:purine-nucleoside phosphorylase